MSDLRILYISSVDVSLTKGPSTNEREFIPVLYELIGERSHFLIPKPQMGLPKDIPKSACTFTISHRGRRPIYWLLHQISILKKSKEILISNKFDLIVIRTDVFDFSYCLVTHKYGVPYAIKTAGSGQFNVFSRKNFILKSLKWVNQYLYNSLVKNSLYVDVVSPMQLASLRELTGAGEKIQCIDNGVNIRRFKPFITDHYKNELGLNRYKKIIGYAGNFPWTRGGKQIVQSLPELSKIYPDVGAVILGDGPCMNKLYNLSKELNVYERCVFTGKVPYEDVVKYINLMNLCVSQRYMDTQGASELKVRQYLACGKPVIVSPGGANDFVEEIGVGYIVDPNDNVKFVESVIAIFNLKESEYQAISDKARKYAVECLSYSSKVMERIKAWENALKK